MSIQKRKKIMTAVIIMSVVVFIASALAASANLSGYDRLKAAGFKLAEEYDKESGAYSNGVYWINGSIYMNDEEVIRSEQIIMRDGTRELKSEATHYKDGLFSMFGVSGYTDKNNTVTYTDEDSVYHWNEDGVLTTRENYWKRYRQNNAMEDTERITPAQRRLIEAVADALIGETRSYFVSEGDAVSISLSGNQIPQIAQYAIAAFAERYANSASANIANYMDVDSVLLGADARFSRGSLEVRIDENGNVTGGKLSVEVVSTVNGNPQTYRIDAELLTKHIGATTVQKPANKNVDKPVLPSYDDDSPAVAVFTSLMSVA